MTRRQVEAIIDTLAKEPALKTKLAGILALGPGAVNGRFGRILGETRDIRKEIRDIRNDMASWAKEADRRMTAWTEAADRRMEKALNLGVLRVQAVVGGYRQRAGAALEDTISALLRVVLGPEGLGPEHVRVRQEWTDGHGKHEIDLVVTDGVQYVVEITWDFRDLREKDLDALSAKMDCAIRHWGLANAKKVLVAVDKDADLPGRCERLGLMLV